MIVETIFSTLDACGKPNFAPMGLVWGDETVLVRPFRNTATCRNVLSTRFGVANLSDDILAYVQCALYDGDLPHFAAKTGPGVVFSNTCSWRELEVVSEAGDDQRAEFLCRITHEGRQKDFLGFRRSSNAVLEATIMATRPMFYDSGTLEQILTQCGIIVEKTGDQRDKEALELLRDFVRRGV